MADAAQMLSGFNSHLFVALFGVAIALATVFFQYHSIASILKWLALTLFAYVITAFVIGPDWRAVATTPSFRHCRRDMRHGRMMVAILGTTISPYLFFWQASQEVEEKKAAGRRMIARRGASRHELACANRISA